MLFTHDVTLIGTCIIRLSLFLMKHELSEKRVIYRLLYYLEIVVSSFSVIKAANLLPQFYFVKVSPLFVSQDKMSRKQMLVLKKVKTFVYSLGRHLTG